MRAIQQVGCYLRYYELTISCVFSLGLDLAVRSHLVAQRNVVRTQTYFAQYTVSSFPCVFWKHVIRFLYRRASRHSIDYTALVRSHPVAQRNLVRTQTYFAQYTV